MKKDKIYELRIDEDDELSGIDSISLVSEPAIEINWLAFNKVTPEEFHIPDNEDDKYIQKLLTTAQNEQELFDDGWVVDSIEVLDGKNSFVSTNPNGPSVEDEQEYNVRYKYILNPKISQRAIIDTTRDFCKTLINRNFVWRVEDMDATQNDFGQSAMVWRGGYNCRHVWSRIKYKKDATITNKASVNKGKTEVGGFPNDLVPDLRVLGYSEPDTVTNKTLGNPSPSTIKNLGLSKEDFVEDCPIATQDVEVNLKNRQNAIDKASYGPLNPNEPNDEYWEKKAKMFGGDLESAKKARCGNCAFFIQTEKMLDCIGEGIGEGKDPETIIDAGELGYCAAFDFKCAAARTCDAWVVGGPIVDEDLGYDVGTITGYVDEGIRKKKKRDNYAEVGPRGGIKASPKAPASDTKNPNPKGEGTAKGSASGKRGAEVSAANEETLKNKVKEFNEKESNTKNGNATLGALKSVFQRGLGAFNTSRSPVVRSAEQWAFARVNAFLYLLKNGRPENPKYDTDYDLLPNSHPKARKNMSAIIICKECGHSWDIEDGGDDPYMCHKCGYDNKQDFESYSDYPDSVKNNAQAVLDYVEENGWGSCGTNIGRGRATDLANGSPLSEDTIKRMYSYLSRHEVDLDSSKSYDDGCGKLMYDAWGGKSGLTWADSKINSIERQKLSKQKFQTDDEKRIVIGPAMVPDLKIYRKDKKGNPYFVTFKEDTIKMIADKYMRNKYIDNNDTEHNGSAAEDVYVMESWIKESKEDKSTKYGFGDLPVGTWFVAMKVRNPIVWERIKKKELNGFSVSGFFEEIEQFRLEQQFLKDLAIILKDL